MDGRLRLKLPQRRGDDAFFARVREVLGTCPGVTEVDSNALTASVLVRHGAAPAAVMEYAASQGLFRIDAEPEPDAITLLDQFADRFREIDAEMRSLSAGRIDLASLSFLVLLGLGLYQLQQGRVLASGATLLWYAASLALLLPRKPE